MNSHDDLQHEEDVKEDYSGSQDQVSIYSFSLFFCICQLVYKFLTPDKSRSDLNRTEYVGKAFLSTQIGNIINYIICPPTEKADVSHYLMNLHILLS